MSTEDQGKKGKGLVLVAEFGMSKESSVPSVPDQLRKLADQMDAGEEPTPDVAVLVPGFSRPGMLCSVVVMSRTDFHPFYLAGLLENGKLDILDCAACEAIDELLPD